MHVYRLSTLSYIPNGFLPWANTQLFEKNRPEKYPLPQWGHHPTGSDEDDIG